MLTTAMRIVIVMATSIVITAATTTNRKNTIARTNTMTSIITHTHGGKRRSTISASITTTIAITTPGIESVTTNDTIIAEAIKTMPIAIVTAIAETTTV